MLAITAPFFTQPTGYELSELEEPIITDPADVIIRVHAAGINPVDVKRANGATKFAINET